MTWLLLACASAVLVSSAGAAKDGDSFRVLTSPPRMLASIAPGTSSSTTLLVANQSKTGVSLLVRVADLAPDPAGESFGVVVDVGDAPRGAGEWISVDTPTLDLGPGERTTVPVRIRVPADAKAGGHYGALVVGTVPPDGERSDSPVQLRAQLVTHVNVLVPGDVQYGGRITRIRSKHVDGGRLRVTARYENTGNIQSTPRDVKLRVVGPAGSKTVKLKVPETIPGGSRTLSRRVAIPSAAGRFTSRISMVIEDGTTVRSRTVQTTAWRPWVPWAIAGSIAALILLAALPFLRRRREFQRLVQEELAELEAADVDEHATQHDPDESDISAS